MFSPDTLVSRRRLRLLAPALALTSWIVALPAQGEYAPSASAVVQPEDLPESPGRQTTRMRCVTCHGADIMREQRLSRAAWIREVEKMIGWGASVGAAEKDEIVDYLSARFGPTVPMPVASPDKEDPATALLPRCLVCHDLRLIEQQQLTEAGWTREIDKMIGWGATLTESERNPLSDYLAKRYGPRR
jgi:cytochrome c-type biogenesis protein CcmH/NrfF